MAKDVSAFARGYIAVRFDARRLKKELKKEFDTIWVGVTKDRQLYGQLLELLGEKLMRFVPAQTGQMMNFYADYQNGLLYTRVNPRDGFNVAEYQYNTPLNHKKPRTYTYYYSGASKSGKTNYGKGRKVTITVPATEFYHDKARDHWADEDAQAQIWYDFKVEAKSLILKSAKKRGR